MQFLIRVCLRSLQVSKLVILHEEAEDGNAMPDLARPVQAVKLAVDNLIKVSSTTSYHLHTPGNIAPPDIPQVNILADW